MPILKSAAPVKNKGGTTRQGGPFNSISLLPKIVDVSQTPNERRQNLSSSHMQPLRQSVPIRGSTLLNSMPAQTASILTQAGQQLLAYIVAEVQKFVTAKRVTEQAIRELDQKVQLEAYLREKKEAILEDRKAEHL